MDPKESLSREILEELQQRAENAISNLQASESSVSTLQDRQNLFSDLEYFQNLSNEIQQILDTTTENVQEPELNEHVEVFVTEEVGHSCDLCQRDLATDPERPNASLRSLQETSVLSCGHVFHSKCLLGTSTDLDNHSIDPSCIFCISSEN